MFTLSQKLKSSLTKLSRFLLLQSICIMIIANIVAAMYRIPQGITVNNVSAPTPGHQVPQRIIVPAPADTEWAFLISLPSTYDPNGTKLWPMLVWYGPNCVFFPNGDGNDINVFFKVGQENGGPARYMQDSLRANYTFMGDRFIIVSPYINGDMFNSNSGQPQRLGGLHKYLKATYKVDPARVYLTGGCAGGGIIYEYCQYDTLGIAAIVPISFNDTWRSTVDLTKACKLKYTWMRHYACSSDPVVPYQNQVACHTALDNCALTPRRDTLITYATGGHELWTYQGVLKTPPAFDWMLTKINTNASTAVPEFGISIGQAKPSNELRVMDARLFENDHLEIINSNGRVMFSAPGNGSIVNQMVPTLARGLYMVRINHDNRKDAQILLAK